jgi:hypothetical protein
MESNFSEAHRNVQYPLLSSSHELFLISADEIRYRGRGQLGLLSRFDREVQPDIAYREALSLPA